MRRNSIILFVSLFLCSGIAAFADDEEQQTQQDEQTQQAHADSQAKQPPAAQNPDQIVRPSETASPPSTARRILTNVWSDQKAMWTSPFHTKPEDRKWWGLFGLGTAALIAGDQHISNSISYDTTQVSFSKNFSQIGADYTTGPIAAGFYFYGKWKDDPKARETGVLGGEALIDSAIIVEILKLAGGRERPDVGNRKGRFFKDHGFNASFPSGHSIMSWSFASVIAHEYAPGKVAPILAYGLASVVSVSRFTARKHFASDILAGGAMGWFIGRYVYEHHLDPEIHKRYNHPVAQLIPEVNPTLDLRTHTYGVSLTWGR
jgi:membrane-associated phospholipid phosphatase